MTQVKPRSESAAKADQVLIQGDLTSLSDEQRASYYLRVCDSLGLNPHTHPFEYIKLSGKLTLYATRACSDQLRKINGVSIEIISKDLTDEIYTVVARAEDTAGRRDESCGVVSLKGLTGELRANGIMKAETKAKRRATLSICGLGWLDETEVESCGTKVVAPSPSRPMLTMNEPKQETMLSNFRRLLLSVDTQFPGTMQKMLVHYQCDSVEMMTDEIMIQATELLNAKLRKGGAV
jgi:hypothetical protein